MATTESFTSNGLLGSLLPASKVLLPPIGGSEFASNGLLAGTLAMIDDSCGRKSPTLDIQTISHRSNVDDMPVDDECDRLDDHDPGLSTNASDLFTASGLLSESQDDFPEVSELFRQHPSKQVPPVADALHSAVTSLSHFHRMSLRATTFDGKTVYMKRKTRIEGLRNKSGTSGHRMGNLLDVPIHRLMDELSADTAAKLAHPGPQPKPVTSTGASLSLTEDTLWVARYRPHRFTELLGNDRVAREMMVWVKQWDFCVFGKKKGKKRPRDDDENYNPDDEYHRPREKLLLLSGPPGLGKTTMAHVIAQQAGYEVMEINASDARSAQVVDDRIRPALEAGSAVGSSKPVLVIIDEIDGATGGGDNSSGFVHRLVQLTYDKPKGRPGQKRDQKDKRPLLRPIICICNDQNAHSLSKLRQYARQIRFTRPADIRIVKRLREVCEKEGLKADSRALSTLVGVARGDLRGCLNALQFIKARSGEVTETIIRAATAGMKEADSSTISVLNNIFAPMTRKRVKELGMGEEEESKYVGRLSREIESLNNPSTIATGCFAHYPNLRQHDATFSRYEKANEWLTTFDSFSATMYSDGDFGLHAYLSYLVVPFYPLFQERGGQRIERDQTDWESFQLTKTNEEIYKSLSHGLRNASGRLSGAYRHLVSSQILTLEFAPYINRIISPPLRPVNSQVVRPEERELLSQLVNIMVALELRFVQEKAEDGQLIYRLDPPIDVFVTYDGKRASDIAISRYAVRHLVAAEIDAATIARQADVVEKNQGGKLDMFSKTSKMSAKYDSATKTKPGNSSEPASKRPRKDPTDIADKPPVDFFGRLITVPSASSTKAAARKNVEKKYRVTYRYTEGTSAAVRKPVKVGAFM